MPIPLLQLQEKRVSCREAESLVTELWSQELLQYTDCAPMCLLQLAASWNCPCSQNVTHFRKEICGTCLFRESIPAIPFWNSKHPIPTRSLRSLRAAAPSTSSALLHHAHPFVAAEEKNLSHAEKQMVWSQNCRLQDLLRTIQ